MPIERPGTIRSKAWADGYIAGAALGFGGALALVAVLGSPPLGAVIAGVCLLVWGAAYIWKTMP
jgi:hypothetical protein